MADSDISAVTRTTCDGEEFKESITRFRKALLRTVVYKRDHREASEDYDQSEQLNSSTVDFPSSQHTQENGELEEPLEAACSEHQFLPLEQTKEGVLKSPIQTTPRNGLSVCPKCTHLQQALATARLRIKQQDSKIAELTQELAESQQLNNTREEETKAVQGKLDGLFAQHLQVLADYKSLANTCQVLERQHSMLQKSFSDAENLNETIQRRTVKSKLKTPLRARPLDEHSSNFDFSGERRVRKCPSLSQTTISRRSESMKLGSQDRHSHVHSPLGRARNSPRASPSLRKRKESAGKVFLTSVRQRIGSSVLGVEGTTKTPKKGLHGQ